MISDAIDLVGKMIRGYPNGGQNAGKSYIGAIAELLLKYPKSVAVACADPFKGVVRDTRFLPTPADVIAWCERKEAPLCEEADREARIAEQLAEREAWETQTIAESLKTKGKRWLDRSDPIAARLVGRELAEQEARQLAGLETIQDANRAVFAQECKAAGIDPEKGISPSLLETLEKHR